MAQFWNGFKVFLLDLWFFFRMRLTVFTWEHSSGADLGFSSPIHRHMAIHSILILGPIGNLGIFGSFLKLQLIKLILKSIKKINQFNPFKKSDYEKIHSLCLLGILGILMTSCGVRQLPSDSSNSGRRSVPVE